MPEVVTIVLADDHPVTRSGIRTTLEKNPRFQVVAEAENGQEAIRFVQQYKPDIAILDIRMPGIDGLEAARQILTEDTATRIVILSMHNDQMFVERALNIGASGYLLKDCAVDEIVSALEHIMEGKCYLSPEIAEVVIDALRDKKNTSNKYDSDSPLTPREREVLALIAEGKTSKEIAYDLHVSVKTIEARRQQIMEKLDIHTIAQLTKYAIREGFSSLDK